MKVAFQLIVKVILQPKLYTSKFNKTCLFEDLIKEGSTQFSKYLKSSSDYILGHLQIKSHDLGGIQLNCPFHLLYKIIS